MRNLEKRLKIKNPNGPIYLPRRDFPKTMHDLRDMDVIVRGKFQVEKINSDAQIVHSLYKYMRKFRAKGDQKNWRGGFLSFLFCILYLL
jgi:hypothetical protein